MPVQANAQTVWSGSGTSVFSGAPPSVVAAADRWLLLCGDSKTALNNTHPEFGSDQHWGPPLLVSLRTALGGTWTTENRGVGSSTVASYSAYAVAGNVLGPPALPTTTPAAVLINLGVNDSLIPASFPSQATWTTNFLTLIDVIRATYPLAPIYIMRWWSRIGTAPADADTEASWVPAMIAARTNVFLGPDERVFLKGSDDGVTNTYDGIHQNTAGHIATAVAWKTVLWP